MIRWLLDTNVLSELRKQRPAPEVIQWIDDIDVENLFTTTVNLAELTFGVVTQKSAERAHSLTQWIEGTIRPWLKGRILEVEERSLLRWRILAREADVGRRPAPAVDLLIAAIAIEHAMHVATRDTRPFALGGIPVLNPWTGERFNGA